MPVEITDRIRLSVGHAANLLLARKPRFVIVATARSGTKFAAEYLSRNGIRCAHEGYFTPQGPTLFNPDRRFGSRGEVSWMAAPFTGRGGMVWVHQVRHPLAVVRSLYKFGFFDSRLRHRYLRYWLFLEQHFQIGPCPLENCLRWYLEWNTRAEAGASYRYRVEDLPREFPQLLERVGEAPRGARVNLPTNVNARPAAFPDWEDGLNEKIHSHPLFPELARQARRYGYAM